jgi:Fe-S cluster biosynthesis and repair protein YggX
MGNVTGILEVPELVECLTTNKCDFRKEGSSGRKYYRFNKIAQQEFRKWLEELQLMDRPEITTDRDIRRLERLVTQIVGGIPDLQQFYGSRSQQQTLVSEPGGREFGVAPDRQVRGEPPPHPDESLPPMEGVAREAPDQASRDGRSLQDGEEIPAVQRLRSSKSGPILRYVEAADRKDISWMEGDTVLINTAHVTYRKAVERKVLEYHNMFAAALAMLREVPTAQEKLELLEKFMSGWGKL